MPIKKHDFIELDYTGRLPDNSVFDTTLEAVAKEKNIHNPEVTYKPTIICVGEDQVVPGLDRALIDKELNKNYTITLQPEEAFGKKDAKQIRLVPMNKFKQQNIIPQPGLQVNIDEHHATILRVSGGRVLVDFNHPLSGKELSYEFTIKRKVTEPKEQIESYLKLALPIPTTVTIKDNKATISIPAELPKELTDPLTNKLKEITKLNTVEFRSKKETNDDTQTTEDKKEGSTLP
jgi:FKBP-type peptidyl-prolyl cis-trans isomerase 2